MMTPPTPFSSPRPVRAAVPVSAALAAALALPPGLAAQEAAPQRAVPADSAVVIEFGGLAGCRQSFAEHGLAQLVVRALERLPADQRRRLLAPWHRQAAPRARQVLRQLELRPGALRGLLQGALVVAVGQRPTLASGVPMPSVAVLLDVSRSKAAATRLLGRLEQHGRRAADGARVHGVPTRVIHLGNPAVADLYASISGGVLVLSNSRGYHADCLAAQRGQRRSLPQNPHYRAGRRHLRGRALGSVWINTYQVMSILDPFLPYEAAAISDALGIGKLRGIYSGCGTDGALGTEVLHIGLAGDPRGVLRSAVAQPVDLGHAKLCSRDTVAFFTGRLDLAACIESVQRLVGQLPAWMRREVRREGGRDLEQLRRIARHLAILDGQVTLAVHAPRVLPIPEVFLVAGVRDEERVGELLLHLMRQAGGERVESQVFEGTSIHGLPVEIENDLGVVPCFAVHRGRLLAANHPHVLKTALRRIAKGDPADSLWSSEDFQRIVPRAKGCSMVGYVATGDLLSRVLGMPQVETALRRAAHQKGLDPEVIPDPEAVVDAVQSILVTGRVDGDGFTLVSRSPLGEGSVLAVLGALLDLAMRDLSGRTI